MKKTINKSIQRKLYIDGNRIIKFPFLSYIPFSLSCAAIGTTVFVIFIKKWEYNEISILMIILNILLYSLCIAVVTGMLAFVLRVGAFVLGNLIKLLGIPDKISCTQVNNEKMLEIRIDNGEDEVFSGEFKILKINRDKLDTPLTMGVFRGDLMDSKLIIPKGESISVVLGLFDDELGYAYLIDSYKQKKVLLPKTIIYTKLSGKLSEQEEIIKEAEWFIDYKDYENGKGLRLSQAVLLESNINSRIDINAKINTMHKKSKRAS